MTNVDKTHVPRGFALNTDGYLRRESFQRRKRQPQRPMVTGVKARSLLKPAINDVRIFATKFNPDESETDIEAYILAQTGVKSTVQKIKTITNRTPRSSSPPRSASPENLGGGRPSAPLEI